MTDPHLWVAIYTLCMIAPIGVAVFCDGLRCAPWRGPFYPVDAPKKDWPAYCDGRF
jgi:hypothetical protein